MSELSGFVFEPELVTTAKSDPGAFTRLYLRHYDTVFKYCVHRLFDRHAAEDITSQVFLSMVESFHEFDGDERQFRNWLYKIATNAVNEHIRKTTRRNAIMTWVRQWSTENAAENDSHTGDSQPNPAVIKKAILRLRPAYQAVITMRFFENLKLEEIADVLGTSAGTVRSQLSRALKKLRRHMSSVQNNGQEVTI